MKDLSKLHGNRKEVKGKRTKEMKKARRREQVRLAAQICRDKQRAKASVMKPTACGKIKHYSTATRVKAIAEAVAECNKQNDPDKWRDVLKNGLRVVTTVSYVDRDYPCLAVEAGRQISTYRQDEVGVREYHIQILEDKKWIDLFVVKKSTICRAGWGLFAARDFVPHEIIGIYAGKVRRVLKGDPVYQPSEFTWSKKQSRTRETQNAFHSALDFTCVTT
jgi:hypothetical protein